MMCLTVVSDGSCGERSGIRDGSIAEALNSYTPQAAQLLTLPDVLAALVDATAAAAKPVGDIDRISIVGGSDGAQGSIGSILGISPQVIDPDRHQGQRHQE